jgi:hypothetical protein
MHNRIDRRAFLGASLVLPAGVFVVSCSSGNATVYGIQPTPGEPPTSSATQAIYTSSITIGHDHTFSISFASFTNPPAGGVSGETSTSDGHTHHVFVAMEDLARVELGSSVTATTTTTAGHNHVFTFVKVANPGRDGGLVSP